MNLALRNRLAEWLLEALDSAAAEAPIRALAAFARTCDTRGVARDLDPESSDALASGGDFFERDGDTLRLKPELSPDLPAVRWRAERFAAATREAAARCGRSSRPLPTKSAVIAERLRGRTPAPPPADEIERALCLAAVLFDVELFFEVHEILEAVWQRAAEPLRTFLQGLIQVAVGYHHRTNGNLRGARSLLAEGNRKLAPYGPEMLGVDLSALSTEVEAAIAELDDLAGGLRTGSLRPPPGLWRTALRTAM
ncbi:MAG: uncharacterized protein QOD06_2257 [Candidatus Binatota bacterium]|nr:uncharacterized protein [Candidatus Binatota bacterium]